MDDTNIVDFTKRFKEPTNTVPTWKITYGHSSTEIKDVTVEGFYVVNPPVGQGMIVPVKSTVTQIEPVFVFPLERLISMHQVGKITVH